MSNLSSDLFAQFDKLNPSTQKIHERLKESMLRDGRSKLIWKPAEGEHIVRVLPYKHNKDMDPFIDIAFHWNLGEGKSYVVCPKKSGLGHDCPICDFVDQIYKTNTELANSIKSKVRYYVPVLVRGQEEEGVKFWGFGADVKKDFYKFIGRKGYENLFHPIHGSDFAVEYIKPSGKAGDYGTRTIMPIPEKTPILNIPEGLNEEQTEMIVRAIVSLIDNMPNITSDDSLFKPKSPEALLEIVSDVINVGSGDTDSDSPDEVVESESYGSSVSSFVTEPASEGSKDVGESPDIAAIMAQVQKLSGGKK